MSGCTILIGATLLRYLELLHHQMAESLGDCYVRRRTGAPTGGERRGRAFAARGRIVSWNHARRSRSTLRVPASFFSVSIPPFLSLASISAIIERDTWDAFARSPWVSPRYSRQILSVLSPARRRSVISSGISSSSPR